MPIIGTDVSFWQDKPDTARGIDFAQMARVAQFTIIRAGQGSWKDDEFLISWQNAKGKLPRGSYWFYDSRVAPKAQAVLYISCFPNGDLGELPLFCDFEDRYGGAYGTWRHWYDFIEELKRLAPNKQIGIYTAYYYWVERTQAAGITAAQLAYFAQYPLWVANYGVSNPRIPKPWSNWTIWQYTSEGNGALYGAESGNIDLNYFNGDANAFAEFTKMPIVTPPTGENTMTEYTMTPINSGTRVRRGHSVYDPLIRSVAAGVVVRGTEVWTAPADGDQVMKGDKWLKLSDGWMAYIHKGALICNNFQEVGVVTPPPPPVEVPAEVELSFTSDKPITILNNGVALPTTYTGKITLRTKG